MIKPLSTDATPSTTPRVCVLEKAHNKPAVAHTVPLSPIPPDYSRPAWFTGLISIGAGLACFVGAAFAPHFEPASYRAPTRERIETVRTALDRERRSVFGAIASSSSYDFDGARWRATRAEQLLDRGDQRHAREEIRY